MRAYSASSEEALHARRLLKEWHKADLLTSAQYKQMVADTPCDLRTTNAFLRLALFLFTALVVAAATMLPLASGTDDFSVRIAFAAVCYIATELIVARARLYRYGIEEAFLVCSVVYLCLAAAWLNKHGSSAQVEGTVCFTGALASLWIWHRFRLSYASLASVLFIAGLAHAWAPGPVSQRVLTVAFFAAGLLAVTALRRVYRTSYLDNQYAIFEALLWVGVYVALNLQLGPHAELQSWRDGGIHSTQFPAVFYWITWLLVWCLPVLALLRAVQLIDRPVLLAAGTMFILTLVTNKLYLGWPRHTWDPILLGVLLAAVAICVRRWLANGPNGIRAGFTAQRSSARNNQLLDVASVAMGSIAHSTSTNAHGTDPSFHFGGGDAGGGGASSNF